MPSLTPTTVDLAPRHLRRAAALQADALSAGFLASLGAGFLRHYLHTYLGSPVGVAVAVEQRGELCGFLVGTVGPGHHRWALSHHGTSLMLRGVPALLARPRVLADFARTRLRRYVRGLASARRATAPVAAAPGRLGALMHVVVDPAARRSGAGAALVGAFEQRARAAGCRRLRLVTLDESGAGGFYERLGWVAVGTGSSQGRPSTTYERAL